MPLDGCGCLPSAVALLTCRQVGKAGTRAGSKLLQAVLLRFPDDSSETLSLLRALPDELLAEILVALPISTYKCGLAVSRMWNKALNIEPWWQTLCRSQWPGVTHKCKSWQEFAIKGGGDMLGECLLHSLRNTSERATKCFEGHDLHRTVIDCQGHICGFCGFSLPVATTKWSCRKCDYNRCEDCFRSLQPSPMLANGATNRCTPDGWTSLHYSCRLGFSDVAESLLDARADIESSDHLHGFTPLMVGATHGQKEICAVLLVRGANKDTMNHYGRTARDCAKLWGHSDLEQLLA
jgi:hypothetical protein